MVHTCTWHLLILSFQVSFLSSLFFKNFFLFFLMSFSSSPFFFLVSVLDVINSILMLLTVGKCVKLSLTVIKLSEKIILSMQRKALWCPEVGQSQQESEATHRNIPPWHRGGMGHELSSLFTQTTRTSECFQPYPFHSNIFP